MRLDESVLKTSWKRLSLSSSQDVVKTSCSRRNISALLIRLQKTSWLRPIYSSLSYVFKTCSRPFQDVFKTSCQDVFKRSSRRLQDALQKRLQDVFKTYSRHSQDVLDTFWRRLQDLFKTSPRRLAKMSSRSFQDLSSSNTVLVDKFSRCLQDIFWGVLQRLLSTEGFI